MFNSVFERLLKNTAAGSQKPKGEIDVEEPTVSKNRVRAQSRLRKKQKVV